MDNNELGTNLAEVGTDLISRRAAIDALVSMTIYTKEELKEYREESAYKDCWTNGIYDAVEKIEKLPPVNNSEIPNSSDTISRQMLLEYIHGEPVGRLLCDKYNLDGLIEQLPPIQPKRGRWISADAIFGGVPFYCSECGENTRDTVMGEPRWNFCPNCGADMREVTE